MDPCKQCRKAECPERLCFGNGPGLENEDDRGEDEEREGIDPEMTEGELEPGLISCI